MSYLSLASSSVRKLWNPGRVQASVRHCRMPETSRARARSFDRSGSFRIAFQCEAIRASVSRSSPRVSNLAASTARVTAAAPGFIGYSSSPGATPGADSSSAPTSCSQMFSRVTYSATALKNALSAPFNDALYASFSRRSSAARAVAAIAVAFCDVFHATMPMKVLAAIDISVNIHATTSDGDGTPVDMTSIRRSSRQLSGVRSQSMAVTLTAAAV